MRRAPRSFQGLGQRWRVGISQGWQASWPYALLSERALLANIQPLDFLQPSPSSFGVELNS